MGEKGNGGHVATGGPRSVRTAEGPNAMGMGGGAMPASAAAPPASAAGSGGGGLLGSVGDLASDNLTDIGGAALGRRDDDSDDE